MAKRRLDVAIAEMGLAESRQKAQALIMAGEVYVNGETLEAYITRLIIKILGGVGG